MDKDKLEEEVKNIVKGALIKLEQFPKDAFLEEVCEEVVKLASETAAQILAFIKEAGYGQLPPLEELEKHYHAWAIANGYVKLADDQSFCWDATGQITSPSDCTRCFKARHEAGWRRVKLEV